ncbi:MAG: ROK family transcriptional regulator [Chloroflexi bacterium]|uniref:ROK family transcriptional regulator n=1 Tax=Candidatus Chlorohelix allophototropha TaxID=3003348 RepID=A0A8T7M1T5_9CHLR|nr:ROK family transcriptional regulator [Chloroflexota bacterium]WJW65576.1 ROK family transcriptional regulator [Chloroflexota bacterium L227-S17]
MPGGTNLPRIRDYNQGVVLEAIRIGDGISRVKIAEDTGLTAQTVSNIVRRLLEEGLVVEAGVDPSGRKPRVKLRINPETRYAVGVLMDRDGISLALLALDGSVVASSSQPLTVPAHETGAIIDMVARCIGEMIENSQIPEHKILGVGVGWPGPMDHERGIVYEPLDLFGQNWKELNLKKALEDRTGLRVLVDNDATAAAIGEHWVGGAQNATNYAYIFMGAGIGAGIFLQDQIYRGDTTNAGEFGHITINFEGPPCFCGNRGCLETYCSPVAMVTKVKALLEENKPSLLSKGRGKIDFEAVSKAALEGDALALSVVKESARILAAGIVSLVNLLDIRLVILGGNKLHPLRHIYQSEVDKALNERLITRNVKPVTVELSMAGEFAGAVGAAALVLHEIYTPRLAGLGQSS